MANVKFQQKKGKEEEPKNRMGRRRRQKGNAKPNNSDRPYPNSDMDNDITWHAKSDQLLNAAGSIPWSWATGRPIPLRAVTTSVSDRDFYLPGIHAIRTVIVPGVGSQHTDAINIACQALYTDIRRELKSANAYEGSDVMIYMIAVADIMSMISWLTRIYATTMLYSFENNYLPDALLRMQNVNPSDLHNRATEFRSRINQLIAKASQIWIPKGFDFITRAKWLYSGYYSEGESIKDQIYMYTPGCFRKFVNLEASDYAGALQVFAPIDAYTDDDHAYTVDSLCVALSDMIDALVGDSDFQNIAGDLFNRYGANGVETFTLIPEDAITFPVFSEEVLEQMMNARCLKPYFFAFENIEDEENLAVFSVNQDETNNVIIIPNKFQVDLTTESVAERTSLVNCDVLDALITTHKDPSPAKTMLLTRDTNVVLSCITKSSNVYEVTVDVAAEIVVSFEVGFRDNTGSFTVRKYHTYQTDGNLAALLSPFHYSPITMFNHSAVGFGTLYNGNIDIAAPITAKQLQDLNRVDLMSLFAVPDVGKVNK